MQQIKENLLNMPKNIAISFCLKITRKLFMLLFIGAILLAVFSKPAQAGWSQSGNTWHYSYEDGSFATTGIRQIDGVNYMFDAAGNMLTGWQKTSSGWLYMNPVSGAMAKGWHQIDGKWYCFNDTLGILYTNCTTPDGYVVDNNGVWNDNSTLSSGRSSSSTGSSATHEKKLYDIYEDYYGKGTTKNTATVTACSYADYGFIDYSKNSSIKSSNKSSAKSYVSFDDEDDEDEEEEVEEELSEKDLYKLITGAYKSKTDPSKGLSEEEAAEKVVEYVNILRSKKGLDELYADDALMEAADIRAEELTEKYSHTRPDGTQCFTVLEEVGIDDESTRAENIAQGQATALQVVNSWYHSAGHRANMMEKRLNAIGVGVTGNGSSKSWVQLFTS